MTDDQALTIMVRKIADKNDDAQTRAEAVKFFLHWVTNGLKGHLSPAQQLNINLPEVEAFVSALTSGGSHPALEDWKAGKFANHPAPPDHVTLARRYVVLLVIALERMGFKEGAARRFAAAEMSRSSVFTGGVTAGAIRHWRKRMAPLNPYDEMMLATGIAVAGASARKLALYFIGHVNLIHNPTAHAVDLRNP
jgi:hypothetical protein